MRDHYIKTYVESAQFPLPEHASPADHALTDEWPREKFQARKKARIEDCKEAAKNAVPAAPKQKPTASVPSCHEVQGFMPGRLEFETEHLNDAEEAVQHMQFDPGDGFNPRTMELEPEIDLKLTVMDIYNSRLTARVERKKIIFEQQLLEYRENMRIDKKRTKEERELFNKAKPFARLTQKRDFEEFAQDLEYELNLRQAITQLQDWRQMQIGDLKVGEKYEHDKASRQVKAATMGSFDRFATSSRMSKPVPPIEIPNTVAVLTASEQPIRPQPVSQASPQPASLGNGTDLSKVLTNGSANVNGIITPIPHRHKFPVAPLTNVIPLKLSNENAPDLHLLTPDEKEICSILRIMPKPYMAIKESMFREAHKHGGALKKKTAKEICRIDATKGGKLFDFFVHSGWISKA